ncbi:hypothetical protein J2T13_000202 [Paenibacillus sp. DS2015]
MSYNPIRKSNAKVPHFQRNSTLIHEMDTIYNGAPDENEDSADCYHDSHTLVKAVRIA